jgi:Flp pilus assembly protein TadG
MIAKLNKARAAFASDERGAVAVIFGLVFAVLILSVGIAIDMVRVTNADSRTKAAADAAALAGGLALLDGRNSDAAVTAVVRAYFDENLKQASQFGEVTDFEVEIDRKGGFVRVKAKTKTKMTVMATQGVSSLTTPASSTVLSEQKDVELGMALDVTGSMGGQKIQDLRDAAKDLVDILLPDGGQANKIRIGLAPYSASVNAGSLAKVVTNNLSTSCVHERGGPQAFTDAAPDSNATYLGWRAGLYCPSTKVEPLTDDKNKLKTQINTLTAGGSTAGHLGAAWASYLVSPEWGNIWPAASTPAAYGDGKTLKAIILMTDGEFNTQYVNANGNSDAQARSICSEAKSRDVVIYAVGFQSPQQAETLLRNCASSADHYFSAQNGSELRQAFVSIAQQLNSLRLTQ